MRRYFYALPLAVAATLCGTTDAHALIIDTFESAQDALVDNTLNDGGLSNSADELSGVVGSSRELEVEYDAKLGGGSTANVEVGVDEFGFLFLENGFVDGRFEITWDGDNDPETLSMGLGAADLTNLGQFDRFLLVAATNNSPLDLTLRVYSSSTSYSDRTFTVHTGNLGDQQAFYVLFSDFELGDGATTEADFGAVGAIQLIHNANGTTGNQLLLTHLETVPEPSSLALLGIGAFGLIGARWRRKRQLVARQAS